MKAIITKISFWPTMTMLLLAGCVPQLSMTKKANSNLPASFQNSQDTVNLASVNWKSYFNDSYLNALIDTALKNNQELNIMLQEIEISKNEIRARKGEYLPFVGLRAAAGAEKTGRFTRNGAVEENLEIKPGNKFPEPLSDYLTGPFLSWELDVWKKLRNAKKSAVAKYMASQEGKNFMVTTLIAEIANSYYELLALDNQLEIIKRNIDIQSNALQIIKQEKEAAKETQLAVNRFEAQLLNTQNLQYDILQQITVTENRINFLVGRFPQPVLRNGQSFNSIGMDSVNVGLPTQLLSKRPDIRKAEFELTASNLDVKIAKANFYPSFRITAGVGLQAFNPAHILNPESIIYNFAGEMIAPLINKNAIKATYYNANAKQIQTAFNYEQAILKAVVEVNNQLAKFNNYTKSFSTKSKEVDILTQSVTISNNLFKSARADYMEVLLTQREALESKMQLNEIKLKQLNAKVNLYQALGGGWN